MKKVLVFGITDQSGGTEAVIMNYYRRFNSKDIHCDFLVNVEKPVFEDEINSRGSKIYKITARSKNYRKYKKELTDFFKKYASKYDVIWVNLNSLTNIDYLKMAKKYGINKRIVHAHNTSDKSKLRLIFHYLNKMVISRYATDFWSCSDGATNFFYPEFVRHRVTIINNAIDVDRFRFSEKDRKIVRKKLGIKDDKIVLINVGRLSFQKNQSFLVEIASRLDRGKYLMLLVGDGEDKEMIEKSIKDLSLQDNVRLLGSRLDVPQLLSASDIYLFPSRYEGLALAPFEAAASGLPLLLSDSATLNMTGVLLQNMNILPLENQKWIDSILKEKTINREKAAELNIARLRNCGYDISTNMNIVVRLLGAGLESTHE